MKYLTEMAETITLNAILSQRQKMLGVGRVSYGRLPRKAQ